MATQLYDIIGAPFGRGTSDATITSNPSTATKCTGTISTTTLNVASVAGFSADDLVLIHQTYNISDGNRTAANLEVNEIGSVGGSSFTLKNNLDRTYTSVTQETTIIGGAQVIKLPEYNNLTMNALNVGGFGRQTNPRGGIIAVAVRNTLTLGGKVNADGLSGYFSDSDHSGASVKSYWDYWGTRASGGFSGGWNSTDGSPSSSGGNYIYGQQAREIDDTRQGNGGGGTNPTASGGGGGNGSAGSAAQDGAQGGLACGNSALTSFMLGGGGGGQAGGGSTPGDPKWTGASGGGGCIIWARSIEFSGGRIEADGGQGIANIDAGGGGGSGGSILINCERGTFGSSLVTANAGGAFFKGGAGGVGRIRINYGATITGTTSPSASTNQDPKLTVAQGAFIMNMI